MKIMEMALSKNELKLIAAQGLLAFADVFRREGEDFHEYYCIHHAKRDLTTDDNYIPTEEEQKIVCKEMERWAIKLAKRIKELREKVESDG